MMIDHKGMTRGGDGSHWEGCDEVHWDCALKRLAADRDAAVARAVKAEAVVERVTAFLAAVAKHDHEKCECEGLTTRDCLDMIVTAAAGLIAAVKADAEGEGGNG